MNNGELPEALKIVVNKFMNKMMGNNDFVMFESKAVSAIDEWWNGDGNGATIKAKFFCLCHSNSNRRQSLANIFYDYKDEWRAKK